MSWSHKGFSHGKNDGIKSHAFVPLKQFAWGFGASTNLRVIGARSKNEGAWSIIQRRLLLAILI